MVILKLWREIIIVLLVAAIGILILQLQKSKHATEMEKIFHKGTITMGTIKNAEIQLKHNIERKKDLENYARQIATANARNSDLIANNHRMQSEIVKYNDRLSAYSNEANAAYAKAASTIYAECRGEYIKMGQYAERLDAEIGILTETPQ